MVDVRPVADQVNVQHLSTRLRTWNAICRYNIHKITLKDLQVYELESFINHLLLLQLISQDEMVNLFCFQIGVSWSDLLWTNRECIRVLSSSFSEAERCSGLGVRCSGLGVRYSGVEALRARCIHLLRKQSGDFPPKIGVGYALKTWAPMKTNSNLVNGLNGFVHALVSSEI